MMNQFRSIIIFLCSCGPLAADAFIMRRVACENFAANPASFEKEPVVVQGLLSVSECDAWVDPIMARADNEVVRVHADVHGTTTMPLGVAAPLVTAESSYESPLYLSSNSSPGSSITDLLPLSDTLEDLFVNPNTEFEDTTDWLTCVGRHAPIGNTLVAAGEGSTSPTICSHPYTKMILCLQGSQLLRVLPPNPHLDEMAKPLTIQGGDRGSRSPIIGSQLPSHLNLFAYRHQKVDETADYEVYPKYAEDPHKLQSSFVPPQEWHSSLMLLSDLVVIPPGWWYQTYNLEYNMNICLHSQRCGGSVMGTQMVQHMVESNCVNGEKSTHRRRLQGLLKDQEELDDYCYTKEEAQELVDQLMHVLSEQRRGDDSVKP